MVEFIKDLHSKPVWMIFLYSWLFYLAGLFMFSYFVWDDNIHLLNYMGKPEKFDSFISMTRRFDQVRYLLSPLWVLLAAGSIWLLVEAGLVVANAKIAAATLFKSVLLGFMILSLAFWVKTVWFVLLKDGYTPDELKNFYPGSIVQFMDISEMGLSEKGLAKIDVFHAGFVLFAGWCISLHSALSFLKSSLLVLCTYGLGLALLQCLFYIITM